MANINISPNMSLPVPAPSLEPGPEWAQSLVACFSILDGHNHSPGSGEQITPTGININADLPFNNSNNATALRSVRFFPNGSPLALATDLGCLYESGVDLYYNDGSGNRIRITQSGSVSGASGTITGLPSGTASASYQSSSGTFQFLQATSTAANMDIGTLVLRYPGSYPTPSGNYIALQVPSSISSGYSLTLPALPAANNTFLTINTDGRFVSAFTLDGVTLVGSGNLIQIPSNVPLPGNGVKIGSNFAVVSSANNSAGVCIARGNIAFNASIISGEGFSVASHVSNSGIYLITLSPAFADAPAVCLTLNTSSGFIYTSSISTSSMTVVITTTGGSPTDINFSFIAIGQRA